MRTVKKPDERRREILETAIVLFAKKGYDSTLIEDITQTLQIAKGSFYNYFKSKQDIFEACIVFIADRTVEKYMAILNNNELSIVERLNLYIEYNFDLSLEEQNKNLFESIHLPTFEGVHSRVIAESTRKLIESFSVLIEEGVQAGIIKSDDAEFTAAALLGALNGAHEILSRRTTASADKHRKQVYDLMHQVLGAEEHTFGR